MPTRLGLLTLSVIVCACKEESPQEPDILELAARSPLGQQVREPDGTLRAARHGDAMIEKAEAALRHIPRPWTVSKLLRRYREARDVEEKALLLRVLAASRDPRAAVLLGETLPHEELELRFAATYGMYNYFLEVSVMGGTEQHMDAADAWWRAHEAELRREAGRLARQWPER